MSLISDALKTAQRTRNAGLPPTDGAQPLLEGFFPYVSTSNPDRRSKTGRLALLGGALMLVLAAVGWFVVLPKLRHATPIKPLPQASVPPQVASPPPAPTVTTAPADSAPPVASVAETKPPTPHIASHPAATETRRVVQSDPPATGRDTATVASSAPAVTPPPPAERSVVAAPPARPNYEVEANALYNAGDYEGARAKFQQATRLAPTASAWTNYGVTLLRLGDPAAAAAAYRTAIGIDANYLAAWLYLGRLGTLTKDPGAVAYLNRALEIDPRNSEVNAELAALEVDAKNYTQARRLADVAVKSDPANWRAHWYYAVAADALKDFEIAKREYTVYLQTIGSADRDNAQAVGYARKRLVELKGKP